MATTALLPLDPATSPQQISRVLIIRANLLPAELMAKRKAQRMRVFVIVALVLVAVLLGTWYTHVRIDRTDAVRELDEVNAQIFRVRDSQIQNDQASTVKKRNETIDTQLKILLAQDLPWAALTDEIRATGIKTGIVVSVITGSLAASSSALPSGTASASTVASLQIDGTGPDKKTIAGYVDALSDLSSLTSPYLTSATQSEGGVSFTLSAQVASSALCGRFITPCKSGGK